MWLIAACFSAVFAGLTSILAKCGIRKTDSDTAMAIRTGVVLIFSMLMVLLVGSQNQLPEIGARSWLFLILSGLATGASWICYFKALSMADVNKVAPIDKSSIIMTLIFAMLFLGETNQLLIKLICTALIGGGTLLMIDRTDHNCKNCRPGWRIYAVLAAVFAALTSILAKVGITGVESNLATTIRTAVILVMAWAIVIGKKRLGELSGIDHKELFFIFLSGLATGASWLCYYYAIQNGDISIVVPIDKMSILLTVIFSGVFLKERMTKKALSGLALMCAGTLIMAVWT